MAEEALDQKLGKLDPDEKTRWYDIAQLNLEGRGWTQTEAFYDRLPGKAKGVVRDPVWNLSHDSAGMCVRFVTDATSIQARWSCEIRKPCVGAHARHRSERARSVCENRKRPLALAVGGSTDEVSCQLRGTREGHSCRKAGVHTLSAVCTTACSPSSWAFRKTAPSRRPDRGAPGLASPSSSTAPPSRREGAPHDPAWFIPRFSAGNSTAR